MKSEATQLAKIEDVKFVCNDEVSEPDDETQKLVSRLFSGDLYIIGRIWIEALKAVLVGAKFSLIPIVSAAKPVEPKRPPPMKYKDLPLYSSPHYEYKDHEIDKERHPEANTKILHKFLQPHVTCARRETVKNILEAKELAKKNCKEICAAIQNKKIEFKKYMRDPNNITMRQGVLAAGLLGGYMMGGGGGLPRRLFFTSLGGLTAGALCFPKETDEVFRSGLHDTARVFVWIYNKYCGMNYRMRERVPCEADLPQVPPKSKAPQLVCKK